MPNIYITDETRYKLDRLRTAERRSLSLQIEFLCDERIKQLNIHDVPESPSLEGHSNSITSKGESQGVSREK